MANKEGFPIERKREILGVVLLAMAAMLLVALATDGYAGEIHRPITAMHTIPNGFGMPGAIVASLLILALGHASHVLYCVLAIWAFMLVRHQPLDRLPSRVLGMVIVTLSIASLLSLNAITLGGNVYAGGSLGAFTASVVHEHFGAIGAYVMAAMLGSIGILLATEFLFVKSFLTLHSLLLFMMQGITEIYAGLDARLAARHERKALTVTAIDVTPPRAKRTSAAEAQEKPRNLREIRISAGAVPPNTEPDAPFDEVPLVDPAPAVQLELAAATAVETAPAEVRPAAAPKKKDKGATLRRKQTEITAELPQDYQYPKVYKRPSLDMLLEAEPLDVGDMSEELRTMSGLLEETLQTFGIEARVTDVTRGPTITRFELEPAPGIKVSRFIALADDIALALKAHRVRVEAPIPGKGRVGIEVPNRDRESVVLRELLESRSFRRADNQLSIALGKDIAGDVVVADLATMPHLLVAGATGAGKTVCVKTLLASLLFAKTPAEMQIIMIDPKMVELSIFDDIPHLITPVVTDPKKASAALNWLITEMEERYRLFAHLRVRNIEIYNESVENGEIEMADVDGEESGSLDAIRKLPYIVCIIDELADLMMLARSEVENAIGRLAQLARAVGIHLIIATQRPSVDVLTGVIKANFPSRISFQVSSRVDSRCILDEIGAERLIGKGDMLYLPPGQAKPTRIQGAFVSDSEMNSLVAYLKSQAPPQYRDEIENFGKDKEKLESLVDADDDLLEDAVRVVLDTGQASISMVQRKLRVGYTRAARLIDMMEVKGIVGPHVGSKPREILVDVAPESNDEVA